MSKNSPFVAQILFLGGCLLCSTAAFAVERNPAARTNWTDRYITNLVEVRMQRNVFVDEFHTNWVTETVTNVIPIETTRTVKVTEYKTNLNIVTLTNRVPVEMVRTNHVELVRTNYVALTQTNWRTLTLTNWSTVLIMKTNWINQPVTNVVQIDLITNRLAPTEVSAPKADVAKETSSSASPAAAPAAATQGTSATAQAATVTDALQIEPSTSSRTPGKNTAELQLKVRWATESDVPLQVRQWRVESQNGAILCSSPDQEFRRDLPLGKYKVEVKIQRDANSPMMAARGVVSLTAVNATLVQSASASR